MIYTTLARNDSLRPSFPYATLNLSAPLPCSLRSLRSLAVAYSLTRPNSHKAMLSYLHSMGLNDTYDSLIRETDNTDFDPNDSKAKWVGLLEKKWTSVIRLQKKVGFLSYTSLGLKRFGILKGR